MYLADRWVEAYFEKVGYVGIVAIIFYTLLILFIDIHWNLKRDPFSLHRT